MSDCVVPCCELPHIGTIRPDGQRSHQDIILAIDDSVKHRCIPGLNLYQMCHIM